MTPELALPTLDNYTRIYRDVDSVADLTSLTYRTDAIIRMTAKTNTTFELINFVPVDLEDVEIVMSFTGVRKTSASGASTLFLRTPSSN